MTVYRAVSNAALGLSVVALAGLLAAGVYALLHDLNAHVAIVSLFAVGSILFFGPNFVDYAHLRQREDFTAPVWHLAPPLVWAFAVATGGYAIWQGIGAGALALSSGAVLCLCVTVRAVIEAELRGDAADASLSELHGMTGLIRLPIRWLAVKKPPTIR